MSRVHYLPLIAVIAACTSSSPGPQNDGPAPAAFALKSAASTAYTLNVTVGGSQSFDVDLDTGSTTMGLVGTSCSDCTNITPVYTPDATAMDQGSALTATYGIGEWSGEIYSDTVVATGDTLAPFTMKFADITDQMDFFSGENNDQGILGFGPAQLAYPGTDAYVADRIGAGSNGVFAIQMCHYDGTLWFGGADKTHEVSDEQYTALEPVSDAQPYYLMSVQGATIDGASLNLSGVALPDTGTTQMVLPAAAGAAFSAAMNSNSGYQSMFVGQDFEVSGNSFKCLTTSHSASDIDAALPKLEVSFNDLDGAPFTLSLSATESYLVAIGVGYCIAVGTADLGTLDNQPFFIFGDAFLRSFISVYDPANSKIGFAPQQNCVAPDDAREPTGPWVPLLHGSPMYPQ
ncbi:MAG TPA: pepsin-like aspartic protease [Kofleriaceae bacterium]|nr:pepsin-like aspartic protease [Kofleriaceae bacterium]